MKVDVVIIGANITGVATAIALEKLGLSVVIIEKIAPEETQLTPSQPYGLRVSAIIPVVQRFLAQLGVWDQLLTERIEAVKQMHVWERHLHEALTFEHQLSTSTVAWIVENNHIQKTCWHLLDNTSCQKIIGQWQMISEMRDKNKQLTGYELVLNLAKEGQQKSMSVQTKLLIAADGAKSSIRQWSGILTTSNSYHQHCIVGNVKTAQFHQHSAWQRYHQGYAFAFLPLADGSCSIAWYVHENTSKELLSLSQQQQKQAIFEASGGMLGAIESIQELAAFPIIRSDATKLINDHVVLVGDAIRTIHPMAGQGVNLGLCDVAVLSDILQGAMEKNIPITEPLLLRRYARVRSEYKVLQWGMDGINAFFSSSMLASMRPSLLKKLNSLSLGKQWLTEVAMGYQSDVPAKLKRVH